MVFKVPTESNSSSFHNSPLKNNETLENIEYVSLQQTKIDLNLN